jgi:hypothetical protein
LTQIVQCEKTSMKIWWNGMLPNDMARQRRSFKILFQEFIHFMVAKGKLKLKTLVFLLKRFNWTSNVGFVVPYIIIFKKWKQQMDINENKSLWKIGCVDDGIKKNLSNMCNSNLWDPKWFLQVRCYLHIWLPTWSASWGMKHTVAHLEGHFPESLKKQWFWLQNKKC